MPTNEILSQALVDALFAAGYTPRTTDEWIMSAIDYLHSGGIIPGGGGTPAIIVTAGSFTGNNAPPIAALAGLTPDTQFMVYSGGTLLDHSLGQYTFAGTTITIPTGAATLRVKIS